MRVENIYFDSDFEKMFKKLPRRIQGKAVKMQKLFTENSFHPSLRVHKLGGKLEKHWSISINRQYRIIFKPFENGDILFISIGKHSIYEKQNN